MMKFFIVLILAFGLIEAKETTQQILPAPFCLFENLYFHHGTAFIANSPDVDPDKAFSPFYPRGFHAESGRNETLLKGTTLFLFETERTSNYLGHFFHLLEHVVGIWSFFGAENYADVKLIVLMTTNPNWPGPNSINQHLLTALFPHAEIKTWDTFLRETQNKIVFIERAFTSDRAISFKTPACGKLNKMLGEALPFLSAKALNQMAAQVNAYAHTQIQSSDKLAVTYIKRHMPRALTPELEKRLLEAIEQLPGVALTVADFVAIPFQEQINIIGNTDVLISVHGNGLSHILFLPQTATAIEILPNDTYTVDYRLFADARGMDYLGINNHGVIGNKEAYSIGMRGNFGTTITDLDIEPILSKIKSLI